MIFIPLRKADASQRLVYGRIDETRDRAGEVMDYATSRPEFEKWSAEQSRASDGKSLGALRAMHKPVAAGAVREIAFDDAARAIDIVAQVVDDAEWQKVLGGVYTGFSPGGSYLKRWQDGNAIRYTASPREISLVDVPCIPSATFSLLKADGGQVDVPFQAQDSMGAGDLAKIAAERDEMRGELTKLVADLDRTRAELTKISAERGDLLKRISALEALPAPGGAHLRVFAKGDDLGSTVDDGDLAKIEAMPSGLEKAMAMTRYTMSRHR